VLRGCRAQTVASLTDRPHIGALRTSQVYEPAHSERGGNLSALAILAALGVHQHLHSSNSRAHDSEGVGVNFLACGIEGAPRADKCRDDSELALDRIRVQEGGIA